MVEVSGKVQGLVTQWLGLNEEERKQFLSLARVQVPTTQRTEPNSDTELLWSALQSEALRLHGFILPSYKSQRHGDVVKTESILHHAIAWLVHTEAQQVNYRTKLALFHLAAEALWTRHQPVEASWSTLVTYVIESVEQSFPGYQRNDCLVKVAQSIADGKLPKGEANERD